MLNNLYAQDNQKTYTPNQLITVFVGNAGVNKEMRDSKLSNIVLYQIAIVFYIHNKFVMSNSIKIKRYKELLEIMESNMETVQSNFIKNDLSISSIEFLH